MRLIDADALVEFWSADFTEEEIHKLRIPLVVAIENIKDAPIVDAVQVVRCKDCKNWDTTWQNDWAKNYHYCPLIDGTRNGDWYCADGERKSE